MNVQLIHSPLGKRHMEDVYKRQPLLNEIVSLAANRWMPDFTISILYTKAGHTKARIPVLEKHRFTASDTFRPGMGYYEKQQI